VVQANKNLAIANTLRVSCLHSTSKASRPIYSNTVTVKSRSLNRSLETAPFDRPYTTYH